MKNRKPGETAAPAFEHLPALRSLRLMLELAIIVTEGCKERGDFLTLEDALRYNVAACYGPQQVEDVETGQMIEVESVELSDLKSVAEWVFVVIKRVEGT